VGNPAIHDSRVLREAETLAGAGYEVTLLARWRHGLPREERTRGFRIVRLELPRLLGLAPAEAGRVIAGARRLHALAPPLAGFVSWLRGRRDRTPLRFAVRRWHAAALRFASPGPAVLHAHDLNMLPVAVRLCAPSTALVYDSHELYLGSRSLSSLPLWLAAWWRRYERGLVRRCDAVITVNESIAEALQRTHGLRERPTVVQNCPPRWRPEIESPRTNRVRDALGISERRRLLLYVGAFVTHRGIEELLEVMRQDQFEGAAAVFLGYGPLRREIEQAAARPDLRDRVFVLDAVAPDDLLEWVASADLSVALIQPVCESYRLSSPNKLFESLAAGTPVVASRLPEIERVLGPDGQVGVLADPGSVGSLRAAIRKVLDLRWEEYEQMRRRARRLALDKHNWGLEGQKLVRLYEALGERVQARSA
jgi:glycosyltransferase involved in cell wall biosynthesis